MNNPQPKIEEILMFAVLKSAVVGDDVIVSESVMSEAKAQLEALIAEECTKARIDELETLSHTKMVEIEYDIPSYIKNRLAQLKTGGDL